MVSSSWTFEPWPVSVMAKQPGSSREPARGRYSRVVALGAELLDGAAEETELDAVLDQQREVVVGQGLEAGDELARRPPAAVLLRHGEGAEPFVGEPPAPVEDRLPVGPAVGGHLVRQVGEGILRKEAPDPLA